MTNKLLLLMEDPEEFNQYLKKYELPDLDIFLCSDTEHAKRIIQECNLILAHPGMLAPILHLADNLVWVQSIWAGVEPLMDSNLQRDYQLTGVKEVFGSLISEYVFAYILALERHLFENRENQNKKIWHKIPYRSLNGLTIGIAGFGSIGQHIAKIAAQFHMHVFALRRKASKNKYAEKIFTPDQMEEFLVDLDYLVLTLPKTSETDNLINSAAIEKMKHSAVLINVGRGNAVVEEDLVQALKKKHIRAAVLDVFNTEPLPINHPLWKLNNAYITPHNAALSFPEEVIKIFIENYQRFCDQKPLKFKIDFRQGY